MSTKAIRVTKYSAAAIVGGAVAVVAGAVEFAGAAVIAAVVVAVGVGVAVAVAVGVDVGVAVDDVDAVGDAGKVVGSTYGCDANDAVKDEIVVAVQRYGGGTDPAVWKLLST